MMRAAFALLAAIVCIVPTTRAAEVELGLRHLASWPLGETGYEGGQVEIVSSRGFAATAEVFFTPRASARIAATFVNPAAFLRPDDEAEIDLNTFSMDTYSLAGRYHFDRGRRLVPFAGAGVAYTSFGNLEERFDDRIELTFDGELSWLIEGGVRYRVVDGLWIDVVVSWMPLEAEPSSLRNDTAVTLPDRVRVNPATVSAGAAWRF